MLKDAHFPQFLLVIYTHSLYSVLCTLYSLLWTLFLCLTLLSYTLYFVLCFRLCTYTLHFFLIPNISFQSRAIFWHFSFFSCRSPIWRPFRLLQTFRSGFPTERPVSWHRHEESTQNEDVVRTPGDKARFLRTRVERDSDLQAYSTPGECTCARRFIETIEIPLFTRSR